MKEAIRYVEIACPVSTVYNQYTQFESFPEFMKDVVDVKQLDDRHLHWVMDIGGVRREFDTEITEQIPEKRISWKSTDGKSHAGVATFHRLDDRHTRVTVQMGYDPEGLAENVADALGVIENRMQSDLERFKKFLETRGRETGAWRGRIQAPHERH